MPLTMKLKVSSLSSCLAKLQATDSQAGEEDREGGDRNQSRVPGGTVAQARREGLNGGKRWSQWREELHSRYRSSPSQGLMAGEHLRVQACGAKCGPRRAGFQPRLRRACGTATRQQVPSRTPNGHSRQHKGGSELSRAATLSLIHSPRDVATALALGPTAGPPALTRHLRHNIASLWPALQVSHRAPTLGFPGLSHPHPSATTAATC